MLFLCLLIIAGYGLLIGPKTQNKTPLLFVCIISMAGMIMFNGSDFPIFDSQQIFKEAGSKRQRERRRERRNGNKLELRDLVPEETAKRIEAFQEANRKPWEEGYKKKPEEEPREIRNIPADTIPALRNYEGGNKSTGNEWADRDLAEAKKIIQEHIDQNDRAFEIPPGDYAFRAAARDLGDTYLITRLPSGGWKVRYDKTGNPIKLDGKTPEEVIKEKGVRMPDGTGPINVGSSVYWNGVPEKAPQTKAPESKPETQPEPPKPESGQFNPADGVPEVEANPAEPTSKPLTPGPEDKQTPPEKPVESPQVQE